MADPELPISRPPSKLRSFQILGVVLLTGLMGCSIHPLGGVLAPNERPTVRLTAAPLPRDSVYYDVHFNWNSSDVDGRVSRYIYAVDPPAEGDTAWTQTNAERLTLAFRCTSPGGTAIVPIGFDYHTFVIKAIDNQGLGSEPVSVSFTSFTVAPNAQILYPSPSSAGIASTSSSIIVRWEGHDPDGVDTKKPIRYKYKA